MTSRGSRRRLLNGNELKERGRRKAPSLYAEHTQAFPSRVLSCIVLRLQHDQYPWAPAILGMSQLSRPCSRAMAQDVVIGLCYGGECGFASGR